MRPARGERAGRCATGRARHQCPGQGSGARGPHRGVVGEQFDQQPHRVERVGAADEAGEGGVDGGEHLEHQIVAGSQVRVLVAEDRRHLGVRQRAQRALADDDATADAGQAVGQRLLDVQDAKSVGPSHEGSWDLPRRSTSMRWWARRRRVAIATWTTATTSRAPISRVSAKTTT